MCCAQGLRSESVPLTMPRMSLKSDGWAKSAPAAGFGRVPGVTLISTAIPDGGGHPLLSSKGCVQVSAGGGQFNAKTVFCRGNRIAVRWLRVCSARDDRKYLDFVDTGG